MARRPATTSGTARPRCSQPSTWQKASSAASWLNIVERGFREIADKRIRRGTFRSVPQRVETIEAFVQLHAPSATPLIWTAQADEILAKVS